MRVDADADDDVAHHAAFTVQAGLGQNAADLPIFDINVVDPFDPGCPAGQLFYRLGNRDGGTGGQADGFRRGQGRVQQKAQIQAAVGGRVEAAPHAAAACGLLPGHKRKTSLRTLSRKPLEHGVCGADALITLYFELTVPQIPDDAIHAQHIACRTQTIAAVGHGFDLIACFPQLADRLPYRRAADEKTAGQLFTRHIPVGILPQDGKQLVARHAVRTSRSTNGESRRTNTTASAILAASGSR